MRRVQYHLSLRVHYTKLPYRLFKYTKERIGPVETVTKLLQLLVVSSKGQDTALLCLQSGDQSQRCQTLSIGSFLQYSNIHNIYIYIYVYITICVYIHNIYLKYLVGKAEGLVLLTPLCTRDFVLCPSSDQKETSSLIFILAILSSTTCRLDPAIACKENSLHVNTFGTIFFFGGGKKIISKCFQFG